MTQTTSKRGAGLLQRKIESAGSSDNFQTPIYPLNVFMNTVGRRLDNAIVVDPACGECNLLRFFGQIDPPVAVTGGDILTTPDRVQDYGIVNQDFLHIETREQFAAAYNIDPAKMDSVVIVTNPPYSVKNEFIEQCLSLRLPFALLMPTSALGSKARWDIFKEHGIELIVPRDRVNYKTPSGKGSGAWFDSAWFCHGLFLPQQINFEDAE